MIEIPTIITVIIITVVITIIMEMITTGFVALMTEEEEKC